MDINNQDYFLSLSQESQELIRSGSRGCRLRKSYLRWLVKSGYVLNPHAESILKAFSGLRISQTFEKHSFSHNLIMGERGFYDRVMHLIQLYGPFLWRRKPGSLVNQFSKLIIQEPVCLVGQVFVENDLSCHVFAGSSGCVLTGDRQWESFGLHMNFDCFLRCFLGTTETQWLNIDTQKRELAALCEDLEHLM